MKTILFVGRRNAARSIIAEACFNDAGIPGWRAFSAGTQAATQVDKEAREVLERNGFGARELFAKPAAIFHQPGAPTIDQVIFMSGDLVTNRDTSDFSDKAVAGQAVWQIADPRQSDARGTARRQDYEKAIADILVEISALIISGRLMSVQPTFDMADAAAL